MNVQGSSSTTTANFPKGRLALSGADVRASFAAVGECKQQNLHLKELAADAQEKIQDVQKGCNLDVRAMQEWQNAFDQVKDLSDKLAALNSLFFLETRKELKSDINIERCNELWLECQGTYLKLSENLTALKNSGHLTQEQLTEIRRPFSKQLLLLLLCLLLFTKTLPTFFPFLNQQGEMPSKIETPREGEVSFDEVDTAVDVLRLAMLRCKPTWSHGYPSCEDDVNLEVLRAGQDRKGKKVVRNSDDHCPKISVEKLAVEEMLRDLSAERSRQQPAGARLGACEKCKAVAAHFHLAAGSNNSFIIIGSDSGVSPITLDPQSQGRGLVFNHQNGAQVFNEVAAAVIEEITSRVQSRRGSIDPLTTQLPPNGHPKDGSTESKDTGMDVDAPLRPSIVPPDEDSSSDGKVSENAAIQQEHEMWRKKRGEKMAEEEQRAEDLINYISENKGNVDG